MKSISTFGSLVKNLNEENKNIKAPLKSYLDIDLNKERYSEKKKEPGHSGHSGHSGLPHHHHHERPHQTDRHHHDRHDRHDRHPHKDKENDDGLQRPTFTNTALEKKPNNFRELDTQGDVRKIFKLK
jgi:hypothetical protein